MSNNSSQRSQEHSWTSTGGTDETSNNSSQSSQEHSWISTGGTDETSNNSSQSSQEHSWTSTGGTDEMSALDSNVIDNIKKALENNDIHSAVSVIKTYLEDINNSPLNIAVTGESGSGKSTFVNVFRGIDRRAKGAARTGVVETTRKPKSYPHPRYPNVTLWDLPGIGTTRFPAKEYLESVDFQKFDFFIILSADRFRENDAMLAQEIRNMGKKFYFVRSKIDNTLRDEKRSQRKYNKEKTLQQIREDCIKGFEAQGVASPQVFLCSQFHLHLYDFVKLQETMERELPSHKRDVLILALPNICKSNIIKKKEVLCSQIKYSALWSALVGAVSIPKLSIVVDISILVTVLIDYLLVFGLDKKSLEKGCSQKNKPVEDLKRVMKSVFSGQNITAELVGKMLASLPLPVAMVTEEATRWITLLGSTVAAARSCYSIYKFLSSALDDLSVDAENVLMEILDEPSAS